MNKITIFFFSLVILCVAGDAGQRLIAFSETHTEWLSLEEVEKLMVNKINFMDITDHPDVPTGPRLFLDPIPIQPEHKIYVGELLGEISSAELQTNLNFLTTFNTRYYTSTTGEAAAKWIFQKFTEIKGTNEEITVELFTLTWLQTSVIATIPGIGPNKDQIVVIGAHEDSVGSSSTGRSPGADDDGTGTVTVIEIFRVLVEANYHPDRTLRFITYAAEEAGLLGSQVIANAYRSQDAPVHAVLQLDMTGYGGDSDIAVIGDFVDANLTAFVKLLIDTYSLLDWVDDRCGYACSDHASWNRAGFRSSFPHEAVSSNPYIHSANDIVSHLSFDRIVEFTKVGVAFAVELAGTTISP